MRQHLEEETLKALEPVGFPEMFIRWPPRRFPTSLSLDLEKDILGLESKENVLKEPDFEQQWWKPLRQGRRVDRLPIAINVQLTETHCHISFRF